jgi:hypothetical protein
MSCSSAIALWGFFDFFLFLLAFELRRDLSPDLWVEEE